MVVSHVTVRQVGARGCSLGGLPKLEDAQGWGVAKMRGRSLGGLPKLEDAQGWGVAKIRGCSRRQSATSSSTDSLRPICCDATSKALAPKPPVADSSMILV